MSKLIIACSLENCVHVGGVMNFLRLAEEKGFRTHFLGPAVPVENLLDAVVEADPEYVAVSYRLTAETARNVFEKLETAIIERGLERYKFILGATEPVAREAAGFDIFKKIFDGHTTAAEVISFLDSILQEKSLQEKNLQPEKKAHLSQQDQEPSLENQDDSQPGQEKSYQAPTPGHSEQKNRNSSKAHRQPGQDLEQEPGREKKRYPGQESQQELEKEPGKGSENEPVQESGQESQQQELGKKPGRELRQERSQAKDLLERIKRKKPLPLIRHHYGQPDLETTLQGIEKIADSGVLDIISLGPDQNTQEFFFKPEKMKEELSGAGGVPIRKIEDFEKIYQASRRGNYPLLRCYSGTNNLIRMAEVLQETLDNAWAAIPLTWYSELDGRSKRDLLTAIKENTAAMKWHGDRDIPVEVNESHHWSLRDAPDVIAVVMAYLAAYNARQNGVKNYLAQYMFNNPAATGYQMDIAKMLAKQELIGRLAQGKIKEEEETGLKAEREGKDESEVGRKITEDAQINEGRNSQINKDRNSQINEDSDFHIEEEGNFQINKGRNFNIITQVRAGLASFPADFERARAQLALSTWQSMVLKPDIVHVVGYTEADHAARADEVIKSCRIAGHIIEKSLQDYPDYEKLERIQARKAELISEAEFLLDTISRLYGDSFEDPLASPEAIYQAVRQGLLDAPHLKNNQVARGEISVKIVDGAVYTYDYSEDIVVSEKERVKRLLRRKDM